MEIREFEVERAATAKLPWQATLVLPVVDVQLGADTDEEKLKRHIAWGVNNGAYFVGMGDYVDVASPSNRRELRSARLYDSVQDLLEAGAAKQVDDFLALVAGSEGRWLGVLQGHHYFEFSDGTTSDTRIAQALKAPFLGTCAFVRLSFVYPTSGSRVTCTIWCHHGHGFGASLTSPIMKLERLAAYNEADVFLVGHQPRLIAASIDQLYATRSDPPKLRHRTRILASTGGFARTYGQKEHDGRPQGGYGEQAMYPPAAIGGVVVRVKPERTSDGNVRLDLGVSL